MTRDYAWPILSIIAFFVVIMGFLGYYSVMLDQANRHCDSLGAVAVSTWDSWICVKEQK